MDIAARGVLELLYQSFMLIAFCGIGVRLPSNNHQTQQNEKARQSTIRIPVSFWTQTDLNAYDPRGESLPFLKSWLLYLSLVDLCSSLSTLFADKLTNVGIQEQTAERPAIKAVHFCTIDPFSFDIAELCSFVPIPFDRERERCRLFIFERRSILFTA